MRWTWSAALKWFAWGFLTLLALAVGLVSLRVLSFNPAVIDESIRPNLIDHPIPFYVHVILGPLALLIGAWQFLPITRRSRYHRYAGRAYVLCCLVSAAAGLTVAFTTAAGLATGTGFAILAVLWFGATLKGYLAGRERNREVHRRWTVRSYALTCSAIALRIILAVGMLAGMSFAEAYLVAAWGCWIVTLVIAELIVRWPAGRVRAAVAPAE